MIDQFSPPLPLELTEDGDNPEREKDFSIRIVHLRFDSPVFV
jgi:hypothetical protein